MARRVCCVASMVSFQVCEDFSMINKPSEHPDSLREVQFPN